jgi:hypothetical protein
MSIRADLIQPTPGESASYGNSAYAGAPPQQRGGDVMGDAMGLLLKERIVFLGSQVGERAKDDYSCVYPFYLRFLGFYSRFLKFLK